MKTSVFAVICLLASSVFAANNWIPGMPDTVQESVTLGSHGSWDFFGDPDNETDTLMFTGGYDASAIGFSGSMSSVDPTTWGNEAAVELRAPDGTAFAFLLNPKLAGVYTTSIFANSLPFDVFGAGVSSLDPAGTWTIEYFENGFDDSPDAIDQTIDSLTIDMLQRGTPNTDSDGGEALGTLPMGDTVTTGEFAALGFIDVYSFTLADPSEVDIKTGPDASSGLGIGQNADTEIALFDADGFFLAADDDGGDGEGGGQEGFYSQLSRKVGDNPLPSVLPAGEYFLAVGTWDSNFESLNPAAGGSGLLADALGGSNSEAALGDYTLTINVVPEPGSCAMLGIFAVFAIGFRRRRS